MLNAALTRMFPKLRFAETVVGVAAEKRAELDLWANHVAVIASQANGANITKLRR